MLHGVMKTVNITVPWGLRQEIFVSTKVPIFTMGNRTKPTKRPIEEYVLALYGCGGFFLAIKTYYRPSGGLMAIKKRKFLHNVTGFVAQVLPCGFEDDKIMGESF